MTNDSTQPSPFREAIPPFATRWRKFDRVMVKETPDKGLGVFSKSLVKTGRAIGRVHGEIMPSNHRSHYCVGFGDQALEPFPPYRFLNHSCEPNCEFIEWKIVDEESAKEDPSTPKPIELWLHAIKDIPQGEELTIDYGWNWQSAIPCRCGSRNCRRWICKIDELDLCIQNRGYPTET